MAKITLKGPEARALYEAYNKYVMGLAGGDVTDAVTRYPLLTDMLDNGDNRVWFYNQTDDLLDETGRALGPKATDEFVLEFKAGDRANVRDEMRRLIRQAARNGDLPDAASGRGRQMSGILKQVEEGLGGKVRPGKVTAAVPAEQVIDGILDDAIDSVPGAREALADGGVDAKRQIRNLLSGSTKKQLDNMARGVGNPETPEFRELLRREVQQKSQRYMVNRETALDRATNPARSRAGESLRDATGEIKAPTGREYGPTRANIPTAGQQRQAEAARTSRAAQARRADVLERVGERRNARLADMLAEDNEWFNKARTTLSPEEVKAELNARSQASARAMMDRVRAMPETKGSWLPQDVTPESRAIARGEVRLSPGQKAVTEALGDDVSGAFRRLSASEFDSAWGGALEKRLADLRKAGTILPGKSREGMLGYQSLMSMRPSEAMDRLMAVDPGEANLGTWTNRFSRVSRNPDMLPPDPFEQALKTEKFVRSKGPAVSTIGSRVEDAAAGARGPVGPKALADSLTERAVGDALIDYDKLNTRIGPDFGGRPIFGGRGGTAGVFPGGPADPARLSSYVDDSLEGAIAAADDLGLPAPVRPIPLGPVAGAADEVAAAAAAGGGLFGGGLSGGGPPGGGGGGGGGGLAGALNGPNFSGRPGELVEFTKGPGFGTNPIVPATATEVAPTGPASIAGRTAGATFAQAAAPVADDAAEAAKRIAQLRTMTNWKPASGFYARGLSTAEELAAAGRPSLGAYLRNPARTIDAVQELGGLGAIDEAGLMGRIAGGRIAPTIAKVGPSILAGLALEGGIRLLDQDPSQDTDLTAAGKGAARGALVGAGLGSVVPGPGTAIGGAIGALGGGLLGWMNNPDPVEQVSMNDFLKQIQGAALGSGTDPRRLQGLMAQAVPQANILRNRLGPWDEMNREEKEAYNAQMQQLQDSIMAQYLTFAGVPMPVETRTPAEDFARWMGMAADDTQALMAAAPPEERAGLAKAQMALPYLLATQLSDQGFYPPQTPPTGIGYTVQPMQQQMGAAMPMGAQLGMGGMGGQLDMDALTQIAMTAPG